jgi:hypothetical protein
MREEFFLFRNIRRRKFAIGIFGFWIFGLKKCIPSGNTFHGSKRSCVLVNGLHRTYIYSSKCSFSPIAKNLVHAGLPDYLPKRGKIYQMTTKCTCHYIPNGGKIDRMATEYTNIFQFMQNFPKVGFFGLKICHLATLSARKPK